MPDATSKYIKKIHPQTAILIFVVGDEEMTMQKQVTCAIVLRIAPDLLRRIDHVRERLSMSRTAWLRKAIRRQLEQAQDELPLVESPAVRRALEL